MKKILIFTALAVLLLTTSYLLRRYAESGPDKPKARKTESGPGVDLKSKRLVLGTLDDLSGPAREIGRPYAEGKRILQQEVNTGTSGLLPPGWKISLLSRDHRYDAKQAQAHYQELHDKVLFLATCFGSHVTLSLRASLRKDTLIAFPASLSSKMAEHEYTPPLGASYRLEAMRAMDWVRAQFAFPPRVAIVYQNDEYGLDARKGWRRAARYHRLSLVAQLPLKAGQKDLAPIIAKLKQAQAKAVLLTTLPQATHALLRLATKQQFKPLWLGNTPAGADLLSLKAEDPAAQQRFSWITGLPYWGEKVPGMQRFLKAFHAHSKQKPNLYILASYIQGLSQLEAFRRALRAGDTSRFGFKRALQSIRTWNADGMIQRISYSQFPYRVGIRTRILQPDFHTKQWRVVAPYALPKTWTDIPAKR